MAQIYDGPISRILQTELPSYTPLFSLDPIEFSKLRDDSELAKLPKGSKRWNLVKKRREAKPDHPTTMGKYAMAASLVALTMALAGCTGEPNLYVPQDPPIYDPSDSNPPTFKILAWKPYTNESDIGDAFNHNPPTSQIVNCPDGKSYAKLSTLVFDFLIRDEDGLAKKDWNLGADTYYGDGDYRFGYNRTVKPGPMGVISGVEGRGSGYAYMKSQVENITGEWELLFQVTDVNQKKALFKEQVPFVIVDPQDKVKC